MAGTGFGLARSVSCHVPLLQMVASSEVQSTAMGQDDVTIHNMMGTARRGHVGHRLPDSGLEWAGHSAC